MKRIKGIYFSLIAVMLFFPVGIIFAQKGGGYGTRSGGSDGSSGTLQNPLKDGYTSIPDFLSAILDIVIKIAIPIIILMIVYSGFLFVKAQGKPEDLVTAKKAIMWTLVGAAVILGASLLSYAIQGTVDEIKRDIEQTTYSLELTRLG